MTETSPEQRVRAATLPWIIYWALLASALVLTGIAAWVHLPQPAEISSRLVYRLASVAASVLFCAWRGSAALKLYQLRGDGYVVFRNGLLRQVVPLGLAAVAGPMAAVGFVATSDDVAPWQLALCAGATVGGVLGLYLHRRSLTLIDDPGVKRMLVERAGKDRQ